MAKQKLPPDFKEFLALLRYHEVEYLLIGGYAVGLFGYVRATADMDIWVSCDALNAEKLRSTLRDFGFAASSIRDDLFCQPGQVVRLGVPPLRLEIHTSKSGVIFDDALPRRNSVVLDGISVDVIALTDLRANKVASGRTKDLVDLEHLPDGE